MKIFFSFLMIIFLIIGCKPQEVKIQSFSPPPGSDGSRGAPTDVTISSISVTQTEFIVNGTGLDVVTTLKLTDSSPLNKSGFQKDFKIISKSFSQIIAEGVDHIKIPVGTLLDLVIANAHGAEAIPLEFELQPNSVESIHLQPGSVDTTHLSENSVPVSKLTPGILEAEDGDIIKWDAGSSEFIMAQDLGAPSETTGTVTDVTRGVGLAAEGTKITTAGVLDVNIGVTGDPTVSTAIPYFNDNNELVLDSSSNNTKLRFNKEGDDFSIFNIDGSLKFHFETFGDLLVLNTDGDLTITRHLEVQGTSLTVGGTNVCLVGDPLCSPNPNAITTITGTFPITVGGTTGSAIIGLDSSGHVSSILSGIGINASPTTGNVGVSVDFNAVQARSPNLDDISGLVHTPNGFILSNGSNFTMEASPTVLLGVLGGQKQDDDLDDIAALSPTNGQYMASNGINWVLQNTPNCSGSPTNYVLVGDGTSFSCTDDTFIFNSGEIRFMDGPMNYVGFKAPVGVATPTVWALPPGDGTGGQVLATDGSGNLVFATDAGGDVSGPATSTQFNLASFSDTSGKGVVDSGVPAILVATNQASITALEATATIFNTRITTNTTDIGTNDVKIAALQTSSTDFNSRINSNEGNISTNTSNIGTNDVEIAALQTSSTDFNGRITTNTTNIGTNDVHITALQASSTGYDTSITSLQAEVDGHRQVPEDGGNSGLLLTSSGGATSNWLPDGDADQILKTDGAGIVSWTTPTVGDVVGPTSSVDNAIARFDGITGKLIKDSPAILSDTGNLTINDGVNTLQLPTTQGGSGQVITSNGAGLSSFAAPVAMASYNCNHDTGISIGGGSTSYLNWIAGGCTGYTSNNAILALNTSDITAAVAGTVTITACLRNLGDGRRFGIRIGTSNRQETQTVLAHSWPCLTITRNISAGQQIRINNPGTGASQWKRATMSVQWMR